MEKKFLIAFSLWVSKNFLCHRMTIDWMQLIGNRKSLMTLPLLHHHAFHFDVAEIWKKMQFFHLNETCRDENQTSKFSIYLCTCWLLYRITASSSSFREDFCGDFESSFFGRKKIVKFPLKIIARKKNIQTLFMRCDIFPLSQKKIPIYIWCTSLLRCWQWWAMGVVCMEWKKNPWNSTKIRTKIYKLMWQKIFEKKNLWIPPLNLFLLFFNHQSFVLNIWQKILSLNITKNHHAMILQAREERAITSKRKMLRWESIEAIRINVAIIIIRAKCQFQIPQWISMAWGRMRHHLIVKSDSVRGTRIKLPSQFPIHRQSTLLVPPCQQRLPILHRWFPHAPRSQLLYAIVTQLIVIIIVQNRRISLKSERRILQIVLGRREAVSED